MDKRESKDNEAIRRPMYVQTGEIQSRLPELLLCLLEGEMVVIKHRGKTIGYLMPRDDEAEQELRELAKAAVERFKEYRRNRPKTGMTTEEALELVRHPLD
ncbi:MAG: hypothetical protein F4X34_06695 [Chloroflexi bacterium]|nr:hypothetical protein [Chloroflexota bacterium]